MTQLPVTAACSVQYPPVVGEQAEYVAHFHTRQARRRTEGKRHQIDARRNGIAGGYSGGAFHLCAAWPV